MSELHRKPLVELISPIASQNEIQIGNQAKIHSLLVFLVKLDKIKKNLPNSWELVPREERLHTGILPMGFIIFSIIIFKPPRFLVSERKFPWEIAFAKSFFAENLLPRAPGEREPWKQVVIGFPRLLFSQQTKVATHTTAKSNVGNLNPNELFYCQYWFQLQINQNIFFSQ